MKATAPNSLCILCLICSIPAALALDSEDDNEVEPEECDNSMRDHLYVVSVLDNHHNWLSGAVFLSPSWALAALSNKKKVKADQASIVYGSHDKRVFPSDSLVSVSKVVYYPWKEGERHDDIQIALIQLAKPLQFANDSYAKLPKDKTVTTNCQRVKAVGWQGSESHMYQGENAIRRCDAGQRRKDNKERTRELTCNGVNFAIFIGEIGFCFYRYSHVNLYNSIGAAILCADGKEDVLVGITTGGGMGEEVGQFTKWIAETTGLEVPFKGEPIIEKHSSTGSANMDCSVIVKTAVILILSSSIGLWQI